MVCFEAAKYRGKNILFWRESQSTDMGKWQSLTRCDGTTGGWVGDTVSSFVQGPEGHKKKELMGPGDPKLLGDTHTQPWSRVRWGRVGVEREGDIGHPSRSFLCGVT